VLTSFPYLSMFKHVAADAVDGDDDDDDDDGNTINKR